MFTYPIGQLSGFMFPLDCRQVPGITRKQAPMNAIFTGRNEVLAKVIFLQEL